MEHDELYGVFGANGEQYEARRSNTSVYRHLGAHAMYDHVFIEVTTPQGQRGGVFIWRDHGAFDLLNQLADVHKSVIHMNLPKVNDKDKQIYDEHAVSLAATELEGFDEVPDDWDTPEAKS